MLFTWFKREGTQKEKLLSILGDGMWHTNVELCGKVAIRFSARIFDLRREGYIIVTRIYRKGLFAYKLEK